MTTIFALTACQENVSYSLDEDVSHFLSLDPSEYAENPTGFRFSLSSAEKEDCYLYRFVLDQPERDYSRVRLLLAEGEKDQVWYFGYNAEYALKKEADPDKNIIKGIALNFKVDHEIKAMRSAFLTAEENCYFSFQIQ